MAYARYQFEHPKNRSESAMELRCVHCADGSALTQDEDGDYVCGWCKEYPIRQKMNWNQILKRTRQADPYWIQEVHLPENGPL